MTRLSSALRRELVGNAWARESGVRPKTLRPALRDGEAPKTLNPIRKAARIAGARDLDEAVAASPSTTMADVADALGLEFDRESGEITTGKIPVTWGEFVELVPLPVLIRAIALALPRRIDRERKACFEPKELVLVEHHVDALRASLKR
jgi:hypothetical protein